MSALRTTDIAEALAGFGLDTARRAWSSPAGRIPGLFPAPARPSPPRGGSPAPASGRGRFPTSYRVYPLMDLTAAAAALIPLALALR